MSDSQCLRGMLRLGFILGTGGAEDEAEVMEDVDDVM
jgi:hypothetical protein